MPSRHVCRMSSGFVDFLCIRLVFSFFAWPILKSSWLPISDVPTLGSDPPYPRPFDSKERNKVTVYRLYPFINECTIIEAFFFFTNVLFLYCYEFGRERMTNQSSPPKPNGARLPHQGPAASALHQARRPAVGVTKSSCHLGKGGRAILGDPARCY